MLILASASPRRRELIEKLHRAYRCMESGYEEQLPACMPAAEVPQYFARKKAEAAEQALLQEQADTAADDIIIGADTVVLLGEQVLGKPHSREEAAAMLRALSGKTHEVITGVALRCGGREDFFAVHTAVAFYPLSEAEIQAYLDLGEYGDKAGAYAIQGEAALFVKEIHGDFYNVIGLPIAALARHIARLEQA